MSDNAKLQRHLSLVHSALLALAAVVILTGMRGLLAWLIVGPLLVLQTGRVVRLFRRSD